MTYDTEQMIFIGVQTPEQSAAVALHYEIEAAAKTAADSLLDLGRKIKKMRDTNGYKALGFETLGDYTKAAIGLNQRQAYNYIAVVEKLPAKLIEQNAAAGVTKLALLAQLTEGEQQEIAAEGDLQDITVKELQARIKELEDKNSGYAEQLCLLQSNAADEAAAQADEYKAELDALQDRLAAMENDLRAARSTAAQNERAAADLKAKLANEQTQAEVRLEKARREGEEKARAEAEIAAKQAAAQALEAEQTARRAAEEQAAALAKQLQVSSDEDMVRFSMLFDRVQSDAAEVLSLCDTLRSDGQAEKADKFAAALKKALTALAEEI